MWVIMVTGAPGKQDAQRNARIGLARKRMDGVTAAAASFRVKGHAEYAVHVHINYLSRDREAPGIKASSHLSSPVSGSMAHKVDRGQ